VRVATALITMTSSMLAVKALIGLQIGKQLFFPWRPVVSASVMALVLYLMGGAIPIDRDHAHLVLRLLWFCGSGAIVYSGTLFLLWFCSGRPDGIEAKAMEILGRTLNGALRYRFLN
jgi:hypothetical protein